MRRLVLTLGLIPSLAFAADTQQNSMDSVLDRLERKLMDQEAASLQIGSPSEGRPAPTSSIRLPTTDIRATLPQDGDFKGLEQQISRMEKEVDELSGQIEALKSDFIDKADQGGLIEISAVIADPDQTAIRELTVSLDTSKIYSVSPGDVPWMPGKQLPIFLGPLEPGEHSLRLEARTVLRRERDLPLDLNTYHRYSQEFKIDVPKGHAHKGYRFIIQRPEQQNTRAQAVLETYDLP